VWQLRAAIGAGVAVDVSLWDLARKKMVQKKGDRLTLTPTGLASGRNLIRSHRLWETYLCTQMGYCETDVHRYAHQLEHFTDADLQGRLGRATGDPARDPHRRDIPKAGPLAAPD